MRAAVGRERVLSDGKRYSGTPSVLVTFEQPPSSRAGGVGDWEPTALPWRPGLESVAERWVSFAAERSVGCPGVGPSQVGGGRVRVSDKERHAGPRNLPFEKTPPLVIHYKDRAWDWVRDAVLSHSDAPTVFTLLLSADALAIRGREESAIPHESLPEATCPQAGRRLATCNMLRWAVCGVRVQRSQGLYR